MPNTDTAALADKVNPNERTRRALPTRRYSVVLETVGATRHKVAAAIARVTRGAVVRGDEEHQGYFVTAADGRRWGVLRPDGSEPSWTARAGEVVSPVLTEADRDLLARVITAIAEAGATTDPTCSLRVLVDGRDLTVAQVATLVTDTENAESLFDAALALDDGRRTRWCRRLPAAFGEHLRRLARGPEGAMGARTEPAYAAALTAALGDEAQCYGLNLAPLAQRGVVELRLFAGDLEPTHVLAAVDISRAMVARAVSVRYVIPGKGWASYGDGGKGFCLRVWMNAHGLVGATFAPTRAILAARVDRAFAAATDAHRPSDGWACVPGRARVPAVTSSSDA